MANFGIGTLVRLTGFRRRNRSSLFAGRAGSALAIEQADPGLGACSPLFPHALMLVTGTATDRLPLLAGDCPCRRSVTKIPRMYQISILSVFPYCLIAASVAPTVCYAPGATLQFRSENSLFAEWFTGKAPRRTLIPGYRRLRPSVLWPQNGAVTSASDRSPDPSNM